MEKGKLIRVSSPPPQGRMIIGLYFFNFSIFFIAYVLIYWYSHPVILSNGKDVYNIMIGRIITIIAAFFGAIYLPFYYWGQGFRIYERGVTLPYSNFFNWYHGYKKEGRFLPYWKILGYSTVLEDSEKLKRKWRKAERDGAFVVYWDDKKNRIRFTMYGVNEEDIKILKEQFRKNGVPKLPKVCPNCGRKLVGWDYLRGECLKCHHRLFEVPPRREKTLK